ncbi:hypothetical protein C2S52_001595 [Perilla frutescens var. hirtella]|nr:hypothetical protein C2S52_001595 [Perilla frutescens var. hirtella]
METVPLLPPGYRFAPTDEELMTFYLTNKALFNPLPPGAVTQIDANDLYSKPPYAIVDDPRGETREWYFFIGHNKHGHEHEQEETGQGSGTSFNNQERRGNIVSHCIEKQENGRNVKIRIVGNGIGFWKAVGRDHLVCASENVSAFKIHYMFFSGSIRKCKKTHWRMEEYHLVSTVSQQDLKKEEWVLGRITRGRRDYYSDY